MMTAAEIQGIVHAVLAEQNRTLEHTQNELAERVAQKVLATLGLDEDETKDIRADFAHLRKWRQSMERVHTVGWTAAMTFVVTGLLAALWLGVKSAIGK
jgi:hypothetical protein